MGANNRYDEQRTVTSQEADEARAAARARSLAACRRGGPKSWTGRSAVPGGARYCTARRSNWTPAGRSPRGEGVPVRGLANALRVALDPSRLGCNPVKRHRVSRLSRRPHQA